MTSCFASFACGGGDGDGAQAASKSGVLLEISTDVASTGATAADIVIKSGGQVKLDVPIDVAQLPGTLLLEGSATGGAGTLPPNTASVGPAGASVEVSLRLREGSKIVVARSATFVMPTDAKRLPLALEMACMDKVCGAGTTCIGGTCVTSAVDSTKLAAY